jgi:serine/threonine protein kinase
MPLTDCFVLAGGSVLQRVSELSPRLRREIGAQDGDYSLSRANSRLDSKVISAETADLIGEFREPSTIARAVARLSKAKSINAERLLEEALPTLRSLILAGFLAKFGSEDALEIEPSLAVGSVVGEWDILGCVQTAEDTEIFQTRSVAGKFGALKLGRSGSDGVRRTMEVEADILRHLHASVTPMLLESGEWNGRPYLLTEWFPGADAQLVCAEFRRRDDRESRLQLLSITGAILGAYARLHELGVIHGDVHPRNVLIDARWRVKIIDLGFAQRADDATSATAAPRGGVAFFFEPEFARANARNEEQPPTAAGEQYSLAAMLYSLLSGAHYLRFSLEKDKMLRQISEQPMIPFAQRGIASWPDIERVLRRALNKHPEKRFSSVAEFARGWLAADVPRSIPRAPSKRSTLFRISADLIEAAATGGALMKNGIPPPCASVSYGSAGLAYALFRVACASDDAHLFALADVWSAKAIGKIGDEDAFYARNLEIAPDSIGSASLYHGPPGAHAVDAFIAHARGDLVSQCAATRSFVETCRKPCHVLDLTLGRAGALLGAALLREIFEGARLPEVAAVGDALNHLGDELQAELWEIICRFGHIGAAGGLRTLGMAHGWAGLLYATCCWCLSSGRPLPDSFDSRLGELAEFAEPISRGLRWPCEINTGRDEAGYIPGWCNGNAGYVFLWAAAHQATGERAYLELAQGAAWNVWESASQSPNLCCGLSGQAYALLKFWRLSGDSAWLRRARDAVDSAGYIAAHQRSTQGIDDVNWRAGSLYKGDAGLVALTADLERPEEARMPLFERRHG